jgi:malonyl-CoA O-methyltransferase
MMRWLRFLRSSPRELDVAEAYERWAPCYPPHAHNLLMELEETAVLDLLPAIQGRAALDLACGSGRMLRHLIERGAAPVVGLDLSGAMLNRARSVAGNLVRADMRFLSLRPKTFDLVTCSLAVGHVRELHTVLKEMARVAVPGGTIVYSDLHPAGVTLGWKRTFRDQNGREFSVKHHFHDLAEHEAACAAAGLRIEQKREPQTRSAAGQSGTPALLAIRARRQD